MPEIEENKKIQMITKLLEKGGTMLATSHECGAPMFRFQGKVLCPVCDMQESETKREPISKPPVQKEALSEVPSRKTQVEHNQIAILTRNTIQNIAATLESETDLQRIKDKLECIEIGIRILKLLES